MTKSCHNDLNGYINASITLSGVLFCVSELEESKFNTLARAGDSSIPEAEVFLTRLEFLFTCWLKQFLKQSQFRHAVPLLKHSHLEVRHVDTLVQLQHLSSWTGVDCFDFVFTFSGAGGPALIRLAFGLIGETPWSFLFNSERTPSLLAATSVTVVSLPSRGPPYPSSRPPGIFSYFDFFEPLTGSWAATNSFHITKKALYCCTGIIAYV